MIEQYFPFFSNYWILLLLIPVSSLIVTSAYAQTQKNKIAAKHRKKNLVEAAEVNENDDEEISSNDLHSALPDDLQHVPLTTYTKFQTNDMIERSLQFYNDMNNRRTVRKFSTEKIPKQVLENIIKTGGTSPSGAHTEPWTFVVVTDDSVKESIRSIIEDEEEINYKRRMGVQWTTDLRPLKTTWVKEYLTDAPALILVFKQTFGYNPDGSKKNHYYNEISVGIATGILLCAIQKAGLVALTSTPLNCGPALRTLLERPKNEKLMILLPVGYPAEDATVPDLSRKPLEEISSWF